MIAITFLLEHHASPIFFKETVLLLFKIVNVPILACLAGIVYS